MGILKDYKRQQHTKKLQESYKLSRAFLETPAEIHGPESTAAMSFTEKLNELFKIELIGYNGIIFTQDQKYLLDERAGIYEYEAGMSREQAENRALKELFNKHK